MRGKNGDDSPASKPVRNTSRETLSSLEVVPDLEDLHQNEVRLQEANSTVTSPEVVPDLEDLRQDRARL